MTDEQKVILLFNASIWAHIYINFGRDYDPREPGATQLSLRGLSCLSEYMRPDLVEKMKDYESNKGEDVYKRAQYLLKTFRKIFGEDKTDEEIIRLAQDLGHDDQS